MKKIEIAVLFCLISPATALAQEFWDPSPLDVQKVDAELANLPNFTGSSCAPKRLTEFGRYYGGFTDSHGRRMIVGQLLLLGSWGRPPVSAQPGIHIARQPIKVLDGGCSVANVWFEADTLKLIQATWGGR